MLRGYGIYDNQIEEFNETLLPSGLSPYEQNVTRSPRELEIDYLCSKMRMHIAKRESFFGLNYKLLFIF